MVGGDHDYVVTQLKYIALVGYKDDLWHAKRTNNCF